MKTIRMGSMVHLVACIPSKCKGLSLNPSIAKKTTKQKQDLFFAYKKMHLTGKDKHMLKNERTEKYILSKWVPKASRISYTHI
jgi:hypothetical protein